uniref:(northern house mosquito) hypothetical protein n=1 Tax=Culex pipiens TaxID=7175 RepID=A0A8D8G150_CULPI
MCNHPANGIDPRNASSNPSVLLGPRPYNHVLWAAPHTLEIVHPGGHSTVLVGTNYPSDKIVPVGTGVLVGTNVLVGKDFLVNTDVHCVATVPVGSRSRLGCNIAAVGYQPSVLTQQLLPARTRHFLVSA